MIIGFISNKIIKRNTQNFKEFFKITTEKIVFLIIAIASFIYVYYWSRMYNTGLAYVPNGAARAFEGMPPLLIAFMFFFYFLFNIGSFLAEKNLRQKWFNFSILTKWIIFTLTYFIFGIILLNFASFFLCGCLSSYGCENMCFGGIYAIPLWIILGIISLIILMKKSS